MRIEKEIIMRKEIAIIAVTINGRITIPEELRRELTIENKDKLKVELLEENHKKSIILTKI